MKSSMIPLRATFVTTPGGEELAVLSRRDFDSLVEALEDLDDAQAAKSAIFELERGEDEVVPMDFARRLVSGEVPVRAWRDYRGMTQSALAGSARINQSYLSEIERGAKEPSVKVLRRLARALDVEIEDLIEAQQD